MSRRPRSQARSSRPESASFCAFALLDTPSRPAIMPGLLGRAACENVPETRPGAPSDADGYDKFREQMEASGASRRFFYAPARWRRSLKTQQCDHAETPGLLGPACLVIQARGLKERTPSPSFGMETTLSTSS